MRTTMILLATVISLTLHSCNTDSRSKAEAELEDDAEKGINSRQTTPVKLIEYLVGEWQMDGGGSGDGTAQSPGEKLTFTTEARYAVYEGAQKIDSGSYRMNEQLGHIYLESDINETPKEFDIDIESRQMTLTSQQSDGAGSGKFVYRRIGQPVVPSDKAGEPQQ